MPAYGNGYSSSFDGVIGSKRITRIDTRAHPHSRGYVGTAYPNVPQVVERMEGQDAS